MAAIGDATPRTPPVVYVGPSAPAGLISAILPGAVVRPPAKRGDIYRDRILRFSVFVLIDGVFAQDEALSPREVVDVLRDGALIIGASSMGALRACDCEVAGAEGVGGIFRLFRRGVVSSEDEVAVTFNPAAPHPALTQSHVNVRIALRRAVRAGWLDSADARRMAAASAAMHFSDRTWPAIAAAAAVPLSQELSRFLHACDSKRDDALLAVRRVAARMSADPAWGHRERRQPGGVFGLDGPGRERPLNVMRARDEAALFPGFVLWLLASGRAVPWLDQGASALDLLQELDVALGGGSERLVFATTSTEDERKAASAVYAKLSSGLRAADEFQSEWLRYDAARLGAGRPESAASPNVLDMSLAGMQIAMRHGYDTWAEVAAAGGQAVSVLLSARAARARGLAFRDACFTSGWQDDGNHADSSSG